MIFTRSQPPTNRKLLRLVYRALKVKPTKIAEVQRKAIKMMLRRNKPEKL